jgi:hypothetical protein
MVIVSILRGEGVVIFGEMADDNVIGDSPTLVLPTIFTYSLGYINL